MSSYAIGQKGASKSSFSNSQMKSPGDTTVFLLCNSFASSFQKLYPLFPSILLSREEEKEERGYVSANRRFPAFKMLWPL